MAITPEECLKLTENEKQQIKDIESRIDATLREKYDSDYAIVDISIEIISSRVFNQILLIYRSTGWEVSIKGTSGKGDRNLSFKKKTPSSSYDPRDR